jgi:hypothetical protein
MGEAYRAVRAGPDGDGNDVRSMIGSEDMRVLPDLGFRVETRE